MCNGWFIRDGQKVWQPMIFPPDYPTDNVDQPKGIKIVLAERGIIHPGLCGKCKKCGLELESCCLKRILENQPDFLAQRSLVQEVIEAAGHMCIFLPKFYCELNFIEYYWSAVKKYLRDHFDFTFDTLKANMLKALQAVQVSTIRKWEHQMYRWMDAYRLGLRTTDAQKHVRRFSSTKYKSHRRILECVARAMDQ